MKVSIEYVVIGREKKYPDVAGEVFVPDEWTEEQIKKWFEERHHNLGGKGVKVITIETIGLNMDLNEAKEILNESGYILTESRGTAQNWIDEVLALDDTLKDQIEEDLMEYYNAYEADNGMVYSRDVGEDSMVDSVFDYVYEDDYENFVSAFGTPEQYVKENAIA